MIAEGTHCMKCGKRLSHTEKGLHKKLINRGAMEFMCITCLAEFYKTTEDELRELAEHFRKTGCRFFL